MTQKVRITHSERDDAEVLPSSLRVWTERGWSVQETKGNPENEVPNNEIPEETRRVEASSASPASLSNAAESDVTGPTSSSQNTAQA